MKVFVWAVLDTRCVLGTRVADKGVVAVPLSTDHRVDLPTEQVM